MVVKLLERLNKLSKKLSAKELLDTVTRILPLIDRGHAKLLSTALATEVALKTPGFTAVAIINPSNIQKMWGKEQLRRTGNYIHGKINTPRVILTEAGTLVTSPKSFIIHNARRPAYVGTFDSNHTLGVYFPKSDVSTITLQGNYPSTLVHEEIHGLDDLFKNYYKYKDGYYTLDTDMTLVDKFNKSIQDRYLRVIDRLKLFSPLGEGSKEWYELHTTNGLLNSNIYNYLFKLAKEAGELPKEAKLDDDKVIKFLRPRYNKALKNMTGEELANAYESVGSKYGQEYAQALRESAKRTDKMGLIDHADLVDNTKYVLWTLPAVVAPVGLGITLLPKLLNNQIYKLGGKMSILIGKSGIHIKKKNRGKFTSYCGGTVTLACINRAKASGNSTLVKRATFAENARKWKHKDGGIILPARLIPRNVTK